MAMLAAIGVPIPVPASVAGTGFASGKAALIVSEYKGSCRLQPGKPGRGADGKRDLASILLIHQGAITNHRARGRYSIHAGHPSRKLQNGKEHTLLEGLMVVLDHPSQL